MLPVNKAPLWRRTLADNWIYVLLLVFLIAFPHIVGALTNSSPYGVERGSRVIMRGESAYWMAVFIEIFALTILVMSYNLMFGFTGVISFGHALFFGIGGYVTGMIWQYTGIDADLGFFASVALTLLITGVVGFLIGLVSLRLKGVYFAIFTLAVAEMAWIYVSRWPVTNGEDGFALDKLPAWIDPSQNRLNLYYIGLVLFVFSFLFIRRLVNSPTGSVFKAIRDNEERAKTIGYHTLRFKLLSITVASMMAGAAGLLHGILNKKLGPEMFGVSHTVDALLMTIIGGVGTLTGPIIGATGLHLAEIFTRDVTISIGSLAIRIGDSWLLILGFIFILAVMVFPYGIVGTWTRLRLWIQRQRQRIAARPTAPAVKAPDASEPAR